MGQSAEEVRREIEQTRAQMGYTIDEIGDRVSPRRMVERRTDRVRTAFRGVRDNVMGTADYGYHQVGSTASHVGSGVAGAASSGVSAIGSGASTAVDTVTSAPEKARRQAAGNPLAAGLIAFGGGVLLASVLPKTRVEEQAASSIAPALAPVRDELVHAGQQVAQELKGSATEAADHLKADATDAAEQVKEQASQAAQHVSEQASAAAGEVKTTTTDATTQVTDEATHAAQQVRNTASPS